MTRPKRTVVLIVFALMALTALAGRQVAVKMMGYLRSLDVKITERRTQLELAQTEANNNKEFIQKWERIRGFRQEPVEDLQNKFTAYLQSLKTFTSLGSPIGRPIEANPEFQVLGSNVSFSANLDDIVEFVAQLDNSERLVRIERIKLTRRADYQTSHEGALSTFFSWSPGDLSVEMTVAVPAGKPAAEPASPQWEIKP